ncbi:MAG: hypothetical protein AB7N80_06015 [Bdellovibrionales bacterium]
MTRIFSLFLAFLLASPAWSQIEIDEYGSARTVTRGQAEDAEPASRRVGLGVSAGGVAGIFGLNLELNFTANTGLAAGFGVSTDYQSLFLGFKHILVGEQFTIYTSGGYARWFASGEERNVGETTPGFVGKRFLSDEERRRGVFAENLLYAGLGTQYLKTHGDWSGSSIYAEVIGLLDLDDLVIAPNLGLGYMYYF